MSHRSEYVKVTDTATVSLLRSSSKSEYIFKVTPEVSKVRIIIYC